VSENRVLRRIFGRKRDTVTGGWKTLHNECYNLHCSPNIIRMVKSRRMRWAGYVVCIGKMRNAFKILVGRPQEKRLLMGE
jgi:hypothetical protein